MSDESDGCIANRFWITRVSQIVRNDDVLGGRALGVRNKAPTLISKPDLCVAIARRELSLHTEMSGIGDSICDGADSKRTGIVTFVDYQNGVRDLIQCQNSQRRGNLSYCRGTELRCIYNDENTSS